MFTSHWGLSSNPFGQPLDPKDYYANAGINESLARLQYLRENRRRLAFVFGATGSGRTTVCQVFAHQQKASGSEVVYLNLMGLAGDEFAWQLASNLDQNVPTDTSHVELWRMIEDRIAANRYQQQPTVLIFDDAEECSNDVLNALARLAQIDPESDSQLTVVLGCHGERSHLLGERLQELCDLRIEMEPWDLQELSEYVRHSLSSVGCHETIFTDDALEKIHHLSEGLPRRINQLAELSLLAGAGADLKHIDAETVGAVFDELSVTSNTY